MFSTFHKYIIKYFILNYIYKNIWFFSYIPEYIFSKIKFLSIFLIYKNLYELKLTNHSFFISVKCSCITESFVIVLQILNKHFNVCYIVNSELSIIIFNFISANIKIKFYIYFKYKLYFKLSWNIYEKILQVMKY